MTDTDDIAENAADLEATYLLLCEFCCEMQFRPASLTMAMAIMLQELAAARGINHDTGLTEIRVIWTKVREASLTGREAVH